MDYLKLVRPINLLIVFITQNIIYYFIIYSHFKETSLNLYLAILLSIATIMITACGYIINDIYDVNTDKINKPNSILISKSISIKNAYIFYFALFAIGFIISVYIAYCTNNFHLLPIYPIAQYLLFIYAKKLKKEGLIGNILIALFTALVPIIIIIAERQHIFKEENYRLFILLLSFSIFAFFINLVRELIKDIEDIEGDRMIGSNSLPIKLGVEQTKFLIGANLIFLMSFILIFTWLFKHEKFQTIYSIFFILFPIAYILYTLFKSKIKQDFSKISKILKLIMFSGLVYLIILSIK